MNNNNNTPDTMNNNATHWDRANAIENGDLSPRDKVAKLYYSANGAMFGSEDYFTYLRAAKRVKEAHGLR